MQTLESLSASHQMMNKAHRISVTTFGTGTCGLISVGAGKETSMGITVMGKPNTVCDRGVKLFKRWTDRLTSQLALIDRSRNISLSCT